DSSCDCARDVAAGENAAHPQWNSSRFRGNAERARPVFRVHCGPRGLEMVEQLARKRQVVHFRNLLPGCGWRPRRATSFRILSCAFAARIARFVFCTGCCEFREALQLTRGTRMPRMLRHFECAAAAVALTSSSAFASRVFGAHNKAKTRRNDCKSTNRTRD